MKMFVGNIPAFVLALACAALVHGQTTIPTELRAAVEQIDALTAAELAKDHLGGVTVGVVTRSGLVWTKSYGYADIEKKLPAARDTVYRIGSITKQFTGLMLLQLVEEGKVHLSDPVEKYLPEVNQVQGRIPTSPPITLLQLAMMTSGIGREPSHLATYLKGPVSDWEKVLIAALPQTKYAFEPGTRFFYSNIGYAILGASLGRAAGEPYVAYVQRRIFAPLGMAHSAFEPNALLSRQLSKGYTVEKGKVDAKAAEEEHQGRGYKVPNGAIYTTVDDLARFMTLELGEGPEGVLPKDALAANFKRLGSADGDLRSGYGVGFMVLRQGDLVVHGHTGAVSGYLAEAVFNRQAGSGVIVLRNVSGGKFNVDRLALQALGKLAASKSAVAR